MNLILLTEMLLLMTIQSDMVDLIMNSLGFKKHTECAVTGLKYVILTTNSLYSISWPPMVLLY